MVRVRTLSFLKCGLCVLGGLGLSLCQCTALSPSRADAALDVRAAAQAPTPDVAGSRGAAATRAAPFPRRPAQEEVAPGCPSNFAFGGPCVREWFCRAAGEALPDGGAAAPFQACPRRAPLPPGAVANEPMAQFQPGTTCTDRALTQQPSCCYEYTITCAR